MNTMSEIEQAVRYLSSDQQRLLLDWLVGELHPAMGVSEPTATYGAPERRELFTLEEFLEMEESSPIQHEYVAGEIFAMAEPSQSHEIVAVNLLGSLHAHLEGRPCRTYTASRRLQFKCFGDDFVYRPDLWVACGDTRNTKGDYVDEPCLVIEVLSSSTARIDKREKVIGYREIPSIKEYVLVAQKPAHVVIYRRTEQWKPRTLDSLEGVLEIRSLELTIPLIRIYKGVP